MVDYILILKQQTLSKCLFGGPSCKHPHDTVKWVEILTEERTTCGMRNEERTVIYEEDNV